MCARDKLSETLEVFSPKSEPSPKTAKLIQYYRLKQKHEQMRKKAGNGEEKCEKMKEKPDFLAIVTEYSRTCFEALSQKTSETLQKCGIKRTPKLRAMSKCIFLLMLAIVVGIFMQETQMMDDREVNRPLWTLLYTICFGTYLGTQTWMALVSGVVLYFSLPRHTFGAVQIKLFPFFYFHNTVMSFLIFLAFTRLQHGFVPWSPEAYQMTSITAALIVQMFVWLLVAPQIVELRNIRTGMEEAAGVGQEIGRVEMAALRHCPRYQAILSRFRRLHLMVTFFTVIILGLSIWHACYLSKKVCM